MAFKVRAMYAFSGEPGTAELTIYEQEVLTVTRTDVGEGWWEGTNSRGQSGLFPETYVERIEDSPPPAPPAALPPLPQIPVTAQPPQHRYERTPDEWEPPGAEGDAWDDDWDDDTYSDIGPASNTHNQPQRNSQIYANTSEIHNYQGDDTMSVTSSVPGGAPRRNINRFASFAKSGGESYILGTLNTPGIADNELCRITTVGESFAWAPITEPYSVTVASPKKESKFKGIKSFMAYQLTPSFNNIQVSRRYKHFDWLHERLVEKFCLIPVPPLPDKQISGRYEEQFIEQRRAQLQEFVDWVCRHPVLSRCKVWTHFLTCTDEKMWKLGKREAEKDKLVGLNSCAAVNAPDKTLLTSVVDVQTETCSNYVHHMDAAVKTLMATCADQTKKCRNVYKQEYQFIGSAFYTFGNALSQDEAASVSTSKLTAAWRDIGTAYIEIGKYFEDQPKHDWYPMSHKLHIHRGILAAFPSILNMHKEAMTKKKECEKLSGENKMEPAQLGEVKRRTEVVSYALLAEISHVRSERDTHIKEALKSHIQEQIQFYQRIVDRLVAAQRKLDE